MPLSKEKKNILIFPAGSEIGIEIYNSLKYNLHFTLYGASGKLDHASFLYDKDKYFLDDLFITSPNFLNKFNRLIKKNRIEFIFPTHDSVALFLSKNKDKLKAEVLTSDFETANIARHKRLTYKSFKNNKFCLQTYKIDDNFSCPVFIKPNIGQGGKNSFTAINIEEVKHHCKKINDPLICEFLPGEEISVDCFTNYKKELLFVGPRTRERVQMGISFNSKSKKNNEILEIAKTINNKLNIRGAWFFQLKKSKEGKFKLLEFAVRQSSTMGLYRQLGVNFALLTLFDRIGLDLSIVLNNLSIEVDRCLFNRYKINLNYNRVYIDFDDTIIVNEKVNIEAIILLYQLKNENKTIILLSKHRYNIYDTLKRFSIARTLFDEIIIIKETQEKHNFIKKKNSIFIDNYYWDRKRVKEKLNIPVFDVDMIQGLLN